MTRKCLVSLAVLFLTAQTMAQIVLISPDNGKRFRAGDVSFVTWQSEPSASESNPFTYNLSIYEVELGVSATDAVTETPKITLEVTDGFTNQKTSVISESLRQDKAYY